MRELDLNEKLDAVRKGEIPQDRLYEVLHEFGETDFKQAEQEVVRFLNHPDPSLRYIAVNVLTLHWFLPKYLNELKRMLLHDPDDDVRRVVAAGLGAVLKGSRDREAIGLLTQRLRDPKENRYVRESAFDALLAIAVPDDSPSHFRAREALTRLERQVREREREIDKTMARGETATEFYASLDKDWGKWVDWDLVGAVERGEIA